MPTVGDVLDGYRLDALIGQGGMGTVYRATDQALEKTVAVKVIARHLADDDTFVRRFREEAKALARLDADGIVDVYAMRETDEALFFVMEHVEGPSLQSVLQRRGALDPSQALSLLRQVLQAVHHAHESGVLHRDLKPSNILLNADGQAVITDFGLAKILASDAELTGTYERIGTVAYMSPEQIEGLQKVNEASDLFSVGLIAYEAFTGRLPFDRSASDYLVQQSIVEESVPPPSTYTPDIPPSVEQVVLNLLAKDPTDRPSSAKAALEHLPKAHSGDEDLGIDPERSSHPGETISAFQWAGLMAVVALTLAGVYVGVRTTLNLPILSFSPPTVLDSSHRVPASSHPETGDSVLTASGPVRALTDTPETSQRSETLNERDRRSDTASSTANPTTSRLQQARDSVPSGSSERTATSPPISESDERTSREPRPTGVLTIHSQPAGATVRLGDSLVGRTPLTVKDLSPNRHSLSLQHEDYRPYRSTVRVSDRDTTEVSPALTPRPAEVTLRVIPSGEILIDGSPRSQDANGTVTDSLPPGSHQFTLISDLGRWETRLQLDAGEQIERVVDFTQRVEGAVMTRTADGTPLPNATVEVDGENVGYTPQRLTLRVGLHTIRVEKEGYSPDERTVLFESDMETPIVFELSPISE